MADAYVLMEVIHDWDDDASRKILRAVRRAARGDAKVLLVELPLPNTLFRTGRRRWIW